MTDADLHRGRKIWENMPNDRAKIFLKKNIFNIWFSPKTIVTLQGQIHQPKKMKQIYFNIRNIRGGLGGMPFLPYIIAAFRPAS